MNDSDDGRITIDEFLRRLTPRIWVTPAVSALIVVGFIIELSRGVSAMNPTAQSLLEVGGGFGPAFYEGDWWRLVTPMFLHAGLLHIAFNSWALWSGGVLTERIYGNVPFAVIYFVSGIGAALTSLAWSPMTVSVDASGAIFGVFGALLAFLVFHRGVFPSEYLASRRNSLLGFLLFNVLFALQSKSIDMAAHAGGFVAGFVAGVAMSRDLARPSAHTTRRLLASVGLVALLAVGAFATHSRMKRVPLVRARILADQAFVRLKANELAPAIDLYTQALELSDDDNWILNRGIARLLQDDLAGARKDIASAQLHGATPQTLSLMCEISARQGGDEAALENAVKDCTAAIEKGSTPASSLGFRATTRYTQDKLDAALEDANGAIAMDPTEVRGRAVRLWVHLKREQAAEAEEDCVSFEKGNVLPSILRACAQVARLRNDDKAERTRLDRAIALSPRDPKAFVDRGTLNEREGRYPEGIADYGAAIAIAPDLAMAWNNRAWIEVLLSDFEKARDDATKAISLDESDGYYFGTRCFAYVGLGDLTSARSDCTRAIALRPDSLADRGMLAFIEKRHADARRAWLAASKDDPNLGRELEPWLAKLPR